MFQIIAHAAHLIHRASLIAGSGDFVLRHDADEVFFFSSTSVADFIASDKVVAQIDMPVYITPDYIRALPGGALQQQGALFRRSVLTAGDHLAYLWLVLPKEVTVPPPLHNVIFQQPVAHVAHLTQWRGPASALNRALFYSMLHAKNNQADAGKLLIDDGELTIGTCLGHPIVSGPIPLDGCEVGSSPLGTNDRQTLVPLYQKYLKLVSETNGDLQFGRLLRNGAPHTIDVTSVAAHDKMLVEIYCDPQVDQCSARIEEIVVNAPYKRVYAVETQIRKGYVNICLPQTDDSPLQRSLIIDFYTSSSDRIRISTRAQSAIA